MNKHKCLFFLKERHANQMVEERNLRKKKNVMILIFKCSKNSRHTLAYYYPFLSIVELSFAIQSTLYKDIRGRKSESEL